MTIILGDLRGQGDVVIMDPPGGFNSIDALRLSSYCDAAIIVTNLLGTDQSQQYLQPNQQNVYPITNIGRTPQLVPTGADTVTTILDNVTVEWSNDPRNDFQGVYPTQISPPAQVIAEAIFAMGVPNVLVEDQLFSGAFANGATVNVNVSKYATVYISSSASAVASATTLRWETFDVNGNVLLNGSLFIPANSVLLPISLPVTGAHFQIINDGGSDLSNLVIDASNRETQLVQQLSFPLGITFLHNDAVNATGTYLLTKSGAAGSPSDLLAYSGQIWAEFSLGNVTCKGQFVAIDNGGVTMLLADTSEPDWHTFPGGGGGSAGVTKMIPLPAITLSVEFVCQIAAGGAIQAAMRYIG